MGTHGCPPRVARLLIGTGGAVLACAFVLHCNGSAEQPNTVKQECPPAPLCANWPATCTPSIDGCRYDPPHLLCTRKDYCNQWPIVCWDGSPAIMGGAACLTADDPPACPGDLSPGAPCTLSPSGPYQEIGNGECYLAEAGVSLEAGIGPISVCACDLPGPIWRCAPGEL